MNRFIELKKDIERFNKKEIEQNEILEKYNINEATFEKLVNNYICEFGTK
ncbi:MAG: hypothetical protein ACRC5T_00995 [Cetobacterium sp.]